MAQARFPGGGVSVFWGAAPREVELAAHAELAQLARMDTNTSADWPNVFGILGETIQPQFKQIHAHQAGLNTRFGDPAGFGSESWLIAESARIPPEKKEQPLIAERTIRPEQNRALDDLRRARRTARPGPLRGTRPTVYFTALGKRARLRCASGFPK